MTIKVFSYGGGVQSTAALVLAAQGKIDYKIFLFANVGEDSEHPETLRYVHEVAMPYARANGIELIELQKRLEDGSFDTVYQRLTRPDSRSIGIPVRMSGSGAPGNRSCTVDFKIKVCDQWLRNHSEKGAIALLRKAVKLRYGIKKIDKPSMERFFFPDVDRFFQEHQPVVQIGLGISLDEIQRLKPNMDWTTAYWKVNAHPLVLEVPKPLTRQDCIQIIKRAGLALPGKSACVFCPFHTQQRWQEMRQDEPEHFWGTCNLETLINQRRAMLGLDPVWFSRKLIPLAQATTDLVQDSLFEDDMCESGYCMV